ncbi:MAG: 4-hydroxyphenylacetate 3-hydroxylase N-terminal domain-containing protein [Bacillota bacterium]
MRVGAEFLAGLNDGREVYYRGRRVNDIASHPVLGRCARHNALVFDLARDGPLATRLVTHDPALGTRISAFYRLPTSRDALAERSVLIQETTRRSRGIFNICKVIGSDALFALLSVTARNESGGEFHERVRRYYEHVARRDLAVAVAQTDVKGDRSLRPHEQPDPDLYVRVKEERPDGIVVRGAKAHITQAPVADELIVIPSRAMQPGDADYSLAFAVPAATPGLRMICRPVLEVEGARHPLEGPRINHDALVEALVIFDDVWVPWESVFVYRQPRQASEVATTFALFHRFSAISYRAAMTEVLVGLANAIAEANGVDGKSHIRRNIVDLIMYAEVQRMAASQAAQHGRPDERTGIVLPDPLYTNLGKLYSNMRYLEAVQALIDCAGGMAITAPSGDDYENPALRAYIDKYLAGSGGSGGQSRFRLFLAIRELVALLGGLEAVNMVHAEGSVEASVIEIYRSYDFSASRALVQQMVNPGETLQATAGRASSAGAFNRGRGVAYRDIQA